MSKLMQLNQELTMSSREIAKLTSKEHKNVLRVIRELITDEILDAQIEPLKFEYRGQQFDYYELNKRDSLVVVARLSPEFTARIIDRWQELEEQVKQPAFDPMVALNDPDFLRGTLLTYTEKVIALEHQVEEMKPDVEALARLSKANGSICITDAAKDLQVKPKDLFNLMSSNKWIYRRLGGKNYVAYQDKIQRQLLEHKITMITTSDGTERVSEQVRITPKGIATISRMLQGGNNEARLHG